MAKNARVQVEKNTIDIWVSCKIKATSLCLPAKA